MLKILPSDHSPSHPRARLSAFTQKLFIWHSLVYFCSLPVCFPSSAALRIFMQRSLAQKKIYTANTVHPLSRSFFMCKWKCLLLSFASRVIHTVHCLYGLCCPPVNAFTAQLQDANATKDIICLRSIENKGAWLFLKCKGQQQNHTKLINPYLVDENCNPSPACLPQTLHNSNV